MLTHSVSNPVLLFSPFMFYLTNLKDKHSRISSDPKCHVPNMAGYSWRTHFLISMCAERPSAVSHIPSQWEQAEKYPGSQVCLAIFSEELAKGQMLFITSIPTLTPWCWFFRKLADLVMLLPPLRVFQINLKWSSRGEGRVLTSINI